MYIKRSQIPMFCYVSSCPKAKPVCSNVIPTTRLHFFIRLELQLRLLRTAVVASHNVVVVACRAERS